MLLQLTHTQEYCNNIATHCNTLQHTATHCNTLQHTATHCNTNCTQMFLRVSTNMVSQSLRTSSSSQKRKPKIANDSEWYSGPWLVRIISEHCLTLGSLWTVPFVSHPPVPHVASTVYVGAKSAGLHKKRNSVAQQQKEPQPPSVSSKGRATRLQHIPSCLCRTSLVCCSSSFPIRRISANADELSSLHSLAWYKCQQQRQQTSVSVFKSNKQTNILEKKTEQQNVPGWLRSPRSCSCGRPNFVPRTTFDWPSLRFAFACVPVPVYIVVVGRKKHRLKEVN